VSLPDPLIVFTPSGKRGRFPVGTPVLQAARALGVDLDSVCGGRGLCGRCQVELIEGEFAKHGVHSLAQNLSSLNEVESAYAARRPLQSARRLSCCARLQGDVVVDVPASSQVHRQVVRKAADARDITLDPVLRVHEVEVERPDMHHPSSDLRRLLVALEREWQLTELACDPELLPSLQGTLRAGGWQVTVAVRAGRQIVGVWPGFHEAAYGLAVDVGSTTIAAHLCDLASGEVIAASGLMNPQIRFGEDLMSRVSYAMMNPGGAVQLTAAVRGALAALAAEVAATAGISPTDILEMTLVGNPIMHHLVLGIDPVELGGAPFALAVDQAVTVRAHDLDLGIHPQARVYALPCIAGHVGADTAAMILAERPDLSEALTLLVDVGTNAEIVLGNSGRLLACSSPTGPAFEGAQISCGQRAAPGAIERVRIDPATLEPRLKIIGSDCWSDDARFAADVAGTSITGVCGSGIIEVIAEMYLSGIVNQDGVIDGQLAGRSDRIVANGRTFAYVLHRGAVPLMITQNDVRAIQLAKAALHAGIRLLMERMGAEHVDRIRLAGAFGNHIDVKYALVLGMLPDCELDHVTSAGNAAGTGARIALLDAGSRATIEQLVRRVEKIETAVEPRFQHHFVEAMAIPHKTASYANLRRVVQLPAAKAAGAGAGASGRRGRRERAAQAEKP
jgi:uncharacterized 2Fe-2S/4Fe-4S cluster protein (DUF4445 family)